MRLVETTERLGVKQQSFTGLRCGGAFVWVHRQMCCVYVWHADVTGAGVVLQGVCCMFCISRCISM